MDISVEIHCDCCGSANLSIPDAANEATQITCNDCSADQGTIAELRDDLLACALQQSSQALRADLDKIP